MKRLLFLGIFLLVFGILLKKLTHYDILGLTMIICGVFLKTIYIFLKIKSGEYKPGKELGFLFFGLLFFFIGLYFRNINLNIINPTFLIFFGLFLKGIFIIQFIKIVRSS